MVEWAPGAVSRPVAHTKGDGEAMGSTGARVLKLLTGSDDGVVRDWCARDGSWCCQWTIYL